MAFLGSKLLCLGIQLNYQEIRHVVSLDLGMHLGPDALHLTKATSASAELAGRLSTGQWCQDIWILVYLTGIHKIPGQFANVLKSRRKK